jgi:hypothetical protein
MERAPGTRWIGVWVSPSAVLDAVVKRKIPSLRRELNLRTPVVHFAFLEKLKWLQLLMLVLFN